jgi:hypothetical protein
VIATVSGAALVAQNIPLYQYAMCRQEQCRYHEAELARVILQVADAAYGGFAQAVAQPIAVSFPEPYPDLPPESPEAYLDELKDRGELSEIQVVMRRFKYTREQAIEHLEAVYKDAAEVAKLKAKYGVQEPVAPPQPAQAQPETDQTNSQ